MAQVIYEEGDEEYWQAPLREAIVNIGNSWAGGVIRRQTQAYDYAKNVANNAHQTFLTQMGIKSREKIAHSSLTATKERNKVLDRQNARTWRINKQREAREQEKFAIEKTNHANDVAATGAAQDLLASYENFQIDKNGNIAVTGLTEDHRKELRDTLKLSPSINATFFPAIRDYNKRQKVIAGRLQMLKALQGQYDSKPGAVPNAPTVISKILQVNQPITIEQLKGEPGKEYLQALSREVRGDESWARILESYKIDKTTATTLKAPQFDGLVAHGQMLGDMSLSNVDYEYSPTSGMQLGRNKAYFEGKKHFANAFKAGDTSNAALFASINNLEAGHPEIAKNAVNMVAGAATNFMQDNKVYFTNPDALTSALRLKMTRVAQSGPGATLTHTFKDSKGKTVTSESDLGDDPTDQLIHKLMFSEGTPGEQKILADKIMKTFVKSQKWHTGSSPKIKSIVGTRPEGTKEIANLFPQDGAPDEEVADDETIESVNNGVIVGDGTPSMTSQLGAAEIPNPMTDNIGDLGNKTGSSLLKDGYLMKSMNSRAGAEQISGLADGKVKDGTLDLRKIPTAQLNHIMFSGKTDTPEQKFWTKKLADMQVKASSGLGDWAPNKTYRHLKELYEVNEDIASQVMTQPGYREHLFSQNGAPLAWLRATNATPKDEKIDWTSLTEDFKRADPPIEEGDKRWVMWDTIFKALNINKGLRDDGSDFGSGARIRRLVQKFMIQATRTDISG